MTFFPNTIEADKIVNDAFANIYNIEPNAQEDRVKTIRIHIDLVANAAQKIALHIPYMDKDKAYVYGLLHDYGKLCGDCLGKRCFHGLIGYYELLKIVPQNLAKISLTHSFLEKNFSIDDYTGYQKDDLLIIKKLLENIEYDDYDRLIQLCDLLVNNIDGYNPIEERLERVKNYYDIPQNVVDKVLSQAQDLKTYFERKCNCNIYKILGIKED